MYLRKGGKSTDYFIPPEVCVMMNTIIDCKNKVCIWKCRQSKVTLIKPVRLFQSHALLGSLKEPKSKYRRKNVHIKTYIIKNIMLSCLISESTVHVF